jgi:hypothetical protein
MIEQVKPGFSLADLSWPTPDVIAKVQWPTYDVTDWFYVNRHDGTDGYWSCHIVTWAGEDRWVFPVSISDKDVEANFKLDNPKMMEDLITVKLECALLDIDHRIKNAATS